MSASSRAHRTPGQGDGKVDSTAPPRRKYRVLIVDDDERALRSISAVLSADVEVSTCTSAEHALKLLESRRFHLVCSDFMMAGMKGDELLRRVSNMPFFTSCLLITGADEYIRSRDGSHHYVILKPFDPARLIGIVLQLARLADMKRSVHSMADSLSAPDAAAPASSELGALERADAGALPGSSRAPSSRRLASRTPAGSAR